MIKGLDVFRDFFQEFQEQYVLIGGAACDMLFEDAELPFRATKDLDMVLIVEALTPEFGAKFWSFIRDGGYENKAKSNGKPQFYRFSKPKSLNYPYMIELFARTEVLFDGEARDFVPLHISEEVSSLSAILLDKNYYQLILSGRTVLLETPILSDTHLILFKAKAWLDLTAKRAMGQVIQKHDIIKHKNDVARLAVLLTAGCAVHAHFSIPPFE